MGYAMYGPWEDGLNRHETAFYQKVAPLLADTPFKYPKVFFAGMYLKWLVTSLEQLSLEKFSEELVIEAKGL